MTGVMQQTSGLMEPMGDRMARGQVSPERMKRMGETMGDGHDDGKHGIHRQGDGACPGVPGRLRSRRAAPARAAGSGRRHPRLPDKGAGLTVPWPQALAMATRGLAIFGLVRSRRQLE
jgi:hypothetical protein